MDKFEPLIAGGVTDYGEIIQTINGKRVAVVDDSSREYVALFANATYLLRLLRRVADESRVAFSSFTPSTCHHCGSTTTAACHESCIAEQARRVIREIES